MNWEDLEKKHQQQWKRFEELKREAWDKIEKDRKAMYAAFGDNEAKIPMSVHERVEKDRRNWKIAWEDHGVNARNLLAIQKSEKDKLKDHIGSHILDQMRRAREKNKSKTKDRERDD